MKASAHLLSAFILLLLPLVSCEKDSMPEEGLILYLPFDGSLNDFSVYHNNGIDSAAGKYVRGINKLALDFNGTTDYIQLTNTINSSEGLSFSFWINSRGANGEENNGVIISKYNMSSNARCFIVYTFGSYQARTDNRLSAAFYKNGNSALVHDNVKSYFEPSELLIYPSDPSLWTIINPVRLEPGEWTHCVINMTEEDIEAWVNGVLCTKKKREYAIYFDSPNEPVYIGNNPIMGDGSNNHFNGSIDELRVYNRGLKLDEIKTLYSQK
jgi:hypothetical protein